MFNFSIIELQKSKKSFMKFIIIIDIKRLSLFDLKLINIFLIYYD